MRKGTRAEKVTNKLFVGDEPRQLAITTNTEYGRALNYYNSEYDSPSAAEKLLFPWMQANGMADDMAAVKAYGLVYVPVVLGAIARMLTNGILLPDTSESYLRKRLGDIVTEGRQELLKVVKEDDATTEVQKTTVRERSAEKLSECIACIDEAIDEICFKGETEFKPYEYFKNNSIKGIHTAAIIQKYKPVIKELQEVIEARDPELKDAYRRAMSMQRIRQFKAWLEQLLLDCGSVVNTARIIRKKRTPKEKPLTKQVESVQYMKECVPLKAISVEPHKIIGAKQAWLYNVKYQQLQLANAADQDKGFTITGTTIKGIDPATSLLKRVKDPAYAVQFVSTAGKLQLRKLMDTIHTAQYPVTGRLNEDTLILRVFN